MDQLQARMLIKNTFQNSFDKSSYTRFIKELLNSIQVAEFSYQWNSIPETFEQYVSNFERVGKYTCNDQELDILIVRLKKETSIERARAMQRNFVAWYLKGGLGGKLRDAALTAFVSPSGDDWRFSLVKMDYRFDQGANGKVKVNEEFTPARRWSFLAGKNENSHTAQSRLAPIIANENDPTLEQLEEAFNIEKVTKEFFEKYRDLFLGTKEALDKLAAECPNINADFVAKSVNTVDFAKKLLGQIVFLYFLQKKGWFGVRRNSEWGSGSRKFLRELFERQHGDYNNFFNDILECLFYEALRIDRSNDDDYYHRFKCKIPFLNGGLFDPVGNYDWLHTDIYLPDKLFSNQNKTKEGDTGDGILDIFDRYNFTVKEDEPLEKEVAIDPELLGKAYEKFNAIRPDNFGKYKKALESGNKGDETKFNKQFGVYYTPREIVHYMCQQSLMEYLAKEVKDAECNPHVSKEDIETLILLGEKFSGDAARVEGQDKKSATHTQKLSKNIRKNAHMLDQKLADITVCDPAVGSGAFPVGMMSEIVKARNVLTSFIADKTDRTLYQFKRHCIEHSLYGVDIDQGAVEIAKLRLWLSLMVDEDNIKSLKPLPNLDYKIVCGNSILGVEKNLFNNQLFSELEKVKPLYFSEANPTQKQEYKKQIDNLISQITDGHQEFDFEVYFSEIFHENSGFDIVIANPPYGANIDSLTKVLEKLYPNTAKSHKDSYKIFIELGLVKLSSKTGLVVYIVPNTLLRQPRYKDARIFLMKHRIVGVLNLGENVFEQAVVPTCVFLVQKISSKNECLLYNDLSAHSKFVGSILSEFKEVKLGDVFADTSDKKERHELTLDSILNFKDAGINYQRVNVGMGEKGKSDLGQRLLYEGEQESLEDIMFWKGRDIDSYFIARKTQSWLRIKTVRKLRHNERVVLNKEYFELTPKLIWRQTASMPIVALDMRGVWFGRSIQAATVKPTYKRLDYKFILGILNSKYISWLYNKRVKEIGRVFPQVKLEYLKNLPFCEPTPSKSEQMIKLVDQMLEAKSSSRASDTSELEMAINQLVYELYGLTDGEIAIVEKGSQKN